MQATRQHNKKPSPKQPKEKKQALRKPESTIQLNLYRNEIRELRRANKIKKSTLVNSCASAVLVINHIVWEHLEKLYKDDEQKFMSHYEKGEPFELLTNSIQLTTRIFYTYLYSEDALDSKHPIFINCRNLWYKTYRQYLLDCNYILEVKNFRAGNYSTQCDDGRGNFKLVINVKDFLFGNDQKIAQPYAVSDEEFFEEFFCPIPPFENFNSYTLNSFQSEIEIKNKVESQESGDASHQSPAVNGLYGDASHQYNDASDGEKFIKAHANQVDTPVKCNPDIEKNSANFANNISDTPSVSDQDKTKIIVDFGSKLSKLYIKNLCKKEFLNENQIRVKKDTPIESLTIRDYTTDFVQLLKHCKQGDEDEISPAFERIKKIIQDKPDWLRKDRQRWVYTPDQYLSTQKWNGTNDFVMKSGSLRAYHDEYTVHIRDRITPSVSGDLEELLTSFYPKLKEFGVTDKFMNDWIEKLGKENFLNEIRRCFARLASGFKPLSKSEYIRRSIRNCYCELVKEKADLAVKKAEIEQKVPQIIFKPSENQIKEWLEAEFGSEANLFGKMQLYALRTNGTSLEILKSEAYRLFKNIKKAQQDAQIVERLLGESPSVADEIKQAHRHSRGQKNLHDFTTNYLKQKFPQYFINN